MLHLETVESSTLELLIRLKGLDSLKESRLVGGTSLSLQYGHRISVDLDLFAHSNQFDFLAVIAEINTLGLQMQIRKQSPNMLISMIENVKVDIVNYPYAWIDQQLVENNIVMATDKEIAAMKISAITNRGTMKDFIDLYCLLNHYTLEEILSFYSTKYNDGSLLMALRSLTYFEDAESDLTPRILDNEITWNKVKHVILQEVKKIS
jgi:predicted nucleotidyltransferase component of viral defense system